MSESFRSGIYPTPVDRDRVRTDWADEGFSFDVFRDPPGQIWSDFVHTTDEYVVVAEGGMKIAVGNDEFTVAPGDLMRIPRGAAHRLETLPPGGSVWLYGYGEWKGDRD